MTSIDTQNVDEPNRQQDQLHLAVEKEGRLDLYIEKWSRWLNPLLIKESRQSLKSFQFIGTFGIMLLAAFFWSMVGLVLMPDIRSVDSSTMFLAGFNWILLFPMIVVVPVWSYWSQVSEQSENSLELVTLSTMKPTQIVSGKFVSALLQVMIYLSVLAPCISFTYLLRGIGIPHIFFSIATILFSGMATISFALFLATSAKNRATQIIFLIGLVILCCIGFLMLGGSLTGALSDSGNFVREVLVGESAGFLGFYGYCLGLGTYSLVCLAGAVSNITFATDNRATRVRAALVIQLLLFIGWSIMMAQLTNSAFLIVFFIFASIHWTFFGMIFVGEQADMSRRVKRALPKTIAGKLLFSWLMPGPQRGFFFSMSSLWGTGLIFAAVITYDYSVGDGPDISSPNPLATLYATIYYCCAYATIYVGLIGIMAYLLRKIFDFPFQLLTLVVGVMVSMFLLIFPWVISASLGIYDPSDAPFLVSPSWAVIVGAVLADNISWADATVFTPVTFTLFIVVLFNFIFLVKELQFRSEEAPQRVLDEIEAENPQPIDEDIDIFSEEA